MDGLKSSWLVKHGSGVFVNPPYDDMMNWIEKATSEFKKNNQPIMMLVPAWHPESQWFQKGLKNSTHVVFIKKRLVHNELLRREPMGFGSALFIFGGNLLGERLSHLSELGEVLETAPYAKSRMLFAKNEGMRSGSRNAA